MKGMGKMGGGLTPKGDSQKITSPVMGTKFGGNYKAPSLKARGGHSARASAGGGLRGL